jgi:hypothetical protein
VTGRISNGPPPIRLLQTTPLQSAPNARSALPGRWTDRDGTAGRRSQQQPLSAGEGGTVDFVGGCQVRKPALDWLNVAVVNVASGSAYRSPTDPPITAPSENAKGTHTLNCSPVVIHAILGGSPRGVERMQADLTGFVQVGEPRPHQCAPIICKSRITLYF